MQTAQSRRATSLAHAAALAAVALVSRLPQLTSPHLILDGDEAVLGLMAKHLSEGGAWPVFFLGQTYGLATVEVAAGAGSFLLAGVGAIPLKLAMLALWTLGIIVFYLGVVRVLGHERGFKTTLLLVLLPAWSVWSMKARGGYITAFVATAVLLYVLIRLREKPGLAWWLTAGALTGTIFLSQRLWLPGAAPIVAFLLWTHRRVAYGLAYGAGVAAVLLAAAGASGQSMAAILAPPRARNPDLIGSVPAFLERIYTNLTGSYYLWTSIEPGPVTAGLARVWYGLLIAATLVQVYRLITRKYLLWSHLLFVSVLSTLVASWVLLIAPDARYLLPLGALLVMWIGVEASDLAARTALPDWARVAAFSALVGFAAWSSVEFRNYAFLWDSPANGWSEAKRMQTLIGHIQAKGIRHVFSLNGLLQWQLMLYSDERIVSRSTAERDRYPEYVTEVDRALDDGSAVAVVGYVHTMGGLDQLVDPGAIITVDDKYWLYVGPDKDLLRMLGFRFLADRAR